MKSASPLTKPLPVAQKSRKKRRKTIGNHVLGFVLKQWLALIRMQSYQATKHSTNIPIKRKLKKRYSSALKHISPDLILKVINSLEFQYWSPNCSSCIWNSSLCNLHSSLIWRDAFKVGNQTSQEIKCCHNLTPVTRISQFWSHSQGQYTLRAGAVLVRYPSWLDSSLAKNLSISNCTFLSQKTEV